MAVQHPLEEVAVTLVTDEVEEDRQELDDVTVTVEDRVTELLADPR
jgi:hypothetical protein